MNENTYNNLKQSFSEIIKQIQEYEYFKSNLQSKCFNINLDYENLKIKELALKKALHNITLSIEANVFDAY